VCVCVYVCVCVCVPVCVLETRGGVGGFAGGLRMRGCKGDDRLVMIGSSPSSSPHRCTQIDIQATNTEQHCADGAPKILKSQHLVPF
jgi:hypothetical protein